MNDYAHFGLGLCLHAPRATGSAPAGTSSWRWRCGPTSPTTGAALARVTIDDVTRRDRAR